MPKPRPPAGAIRIHGARQNNLRNLDLLTVIQDRLRLANADRGRVGEALEASLKGGRGRIVIHAVMHRKAARRWTRAPTSICWNCSAATNAISSTR